MTVATMPTRRLHSTRALTLLIAVAGVLATLPAAAATTYHVRMNTTAWSGSHALLAIDFTGSNFNTVQLLNFEHDGTVGQPGTAGGLVRGDIVLGLNPAFFTQMDHGGPDGALYFFTSLVVNFESLGSFITFSIDLMEFFNYPWFPLDELSLFLLRPSGQPAFVTADPLGANALFSLCMTGQPGGDLSVFSPMTFLAPDTLVLGLTPLAVPAPGVPSSRIRFRSVYPNPTAEGVHFEFELPAAGGRARLTIYDLAGRVVHRALDEARPGGVGSIDWSGLGVNGGRVAPGIYIARLDLDGQSVMRKIAVTR